MKMRHVIGFASLLILVGVALISCRTSFGTTIDARINKFRQ